MLSCRSNQTRLKDLTDSFERPEIRIEARLQVAKILLNETISQENENNENGIKAVVKFSEVGNFQQQLRQVYENMPVIEESP